MINLHHLRLFRAVALEGTLTGAARRLNLSQSALSTQIRALEATLGHDLFARRGRGLVLTEAGSIALDHAEVIFRTAEDLSATLRETRRGRQVLRVGALATLSRNFQLNFLRPMIGRQNVEVVLRSASQDELLRGLEAMALDVVLSNLIPPSDAISPWLIHRIAEQPVSLVGTPGRIGSDGRTLAGLLSDEPLVLPTRGTAIRSGFDALADRLGVTPNIAAEADDMAMLRLLAREDAGLAILPRIVVQDEIASGLLIEGPRLTGLTESFVTISRQRRFPNPLLAELLTGNPRPEG
ncbi:MAG: LysR family transcriptional regulator, partial [Paracoccus sp. (in: a-proteobacteria)]|nr:LysR family transcriptional regulator [Paracoccus sp. (in: a-proteobacteria)]